jgi:hypothetical protein
MVNPTLGKFNVTDTEQAVAIVADVQNGVAGTVIVFAETDDEGLTAGQFSIKHNVPAGTQAGTYSA